jgi:hypothetical protein
MKLELTLSIGILLLTCVCYAKVENSNKATQSFLSDKSKPNDSLNWGYANNDGYVLASNAVRII